MAQGNQVEIEVQPYGTFTARLRDFEMDLKISCRADEQISARGFNPKTISDDTRTLFYLLATFSETCDIAPTNFDVGELMRGRTQEALDFLTSYADQLAKQEARFRGIVPGVDKLLNMGTDPEKAV